jgi:hypothetical protein
VSSSGTITANKVGETYIDVKNVNKGFSAKCKVTVNPLYSMYREPYLIFGKSKTDIKSYETRSIYQEKDSSIMYTGENSYIAALVYIFHKSGYSSSSALIAVGNESLFANYLAERYVSISTSDPILMMTTDNKILVGISVYSISYYMITYVPKPTTKSNLSSKSNSELIETFDDIKNKVKDLYPIK